MAKSNDTQITLFARMAQLRSSIAEVRRETRRIQRSLDDSTEASADLSRQLKQAVELLKEADSMLTPLRPFHVPVDRPIARAEVANG